MVLTLLLLMFLPIDMKFAARKVHFFQNEGPKFEPVGNLTVLLPCVQKTINIDWKAVKYST